MSAPQAVAVAHRAPGAEPAEPVFTRPRRSPQPESAQLRYPVQAKLAVGSPDDPYEREAEHIADQVANSGAPAAVRREPVKVRRLAGGGRVALTAPPAVESVVGSPGIALDPATRGYFETRFGHDFSRVRVHTHPRAAESADKVNAIAYTVGNNVVFGPGRFQPDSRQGRRLIAHELTHVLQQSAGGGLNLRIQRDAVEAAVRFNHALSTSDWDTAARAVAEMSERDARGALSALDTGARARLRTAVLAIDPSPGNPVARMIDAIEGSSAPGAVAAPAPTPTAAVNIAALPATEKLSRAWSIASERLGPDVRREVANLFSRESIAAMAAFAALYIASQLTPAGWVADALVLTMLTLTVLFVGLLAIDVARDIWRYFAAINARSEADLRRAGEALSRAIARGGVALFIALLSRALPRARPPGSSTAAAEAVAVGRGGLRVPVAVQVVQEVPAAIPSHLRAASYAVMVPPPSGSSGGSSSGGPRESSSGSESSSSSPPSSSRPARGPEIWDEISAELGLEPPGTGAGRPGGVAGAVGDARAGGLVGPAGAPGSADLAVQPHRSAPATRGALGITGAAAESAHVAPTSAVRGAGGYSRSGALTTLLDPATHAAFDAYWKGWARNQRSSGRTSCTVAELERVMIDAIDNIPGMAQRTKNALAWRLQMELRELGLSADAVLELPYRNIGPSSGP